MAPPHWRTIPNTVERPSPVPLPGALVVKNGSKARALRPFVHALAGIRDRDDDVAARPDRRSLRRQHRADDLGGARLDRQHAAARHRVAGVDREVHHDLLDLAGVGLDPSGIRGERDLEEHVLADQAPQQPFDPGQHLVRIEDLDLQHLLAADGEELPRQRRRALAGVADAAPVVVALAVRARLLQRQVGGAVDDRQQVVEVVGDAAGEAAQALHLLRLEELRLQLGVVGDVDVRAEQRHLRAALVEQDRRVRQHVAVGAVLVPAAVLDLEVRRLAAQVLADGGDGAVDVVRMDAAAPRLEVRRDLGVLVAELPLPLRRVVDRVRDEAPLPEPDVAGADRALEPHLRLAEAPPSPASVRPRGG